MKDGLALLPWGSTCAWDARSVTCHGGVIRGLGEFEFGILINLYLLLPLPTFSSPH